MNNYKNKLLFAIALVVVSNSTAYAGTLKVINKHPTEQVQLCIRGEGTNEPIDKDSFHHIVKANEQVSYTVEKKHVRGKNTFEVVASTSDSDSLDLKLMGATCSNLVTDADHTIVINSTLGKLSCENVSAANPAPHP